MKNALKLNTILKNYMVIFYFVSISFLSFSQSTIPKADSDEINKLVDETMVINNSVNQSYERAIGVVEKELNKKPISKNDFDKMNIGISAAGIFMSAIDKIPNMVPVVKDIFSLVYDSFNQADDERKAMIVDTQINSIADILIKISQKVEVLFPVDIVFKDKLKAKYIALYKVKKKVGLQEIKKANDTFRPLFPEVKGQEVTYMQVLLQKAILEEIVSQIDSKNYPLGIFYCTVKSSQTCYFKEWHENKDNCVVIREVKYDFSTPLATQFVSLIDNIMAKSKTFEGKYIYINDFNFPVKYRIYQPYNPGSYILPSQLKNSKTDPFYDHDNVTIIAPQVNPSNGIEAGYDYISGNTSHVKSFYTTVDEYGLNLPVFDLIIKKIRNQKINQISKVYLKGSKLI